MGLPREGRRVGESRLRNARLESEGFDDEGSPSLHPFTCCSRVPCGVMVVEVSHDDVDITEVEKRMKIGCEIGRKFGLYPRFFVRLYI